MVDELRLQHPALGPVTEHLQHETGNADPMGSRPTEPDPQSEAAPVGERVPGQTGGASAWFGSGQDPQTALEEVESWNQATRGQVLALTRPGDGADEPAREPAEAARYRELRAEERTRSANALAPLLADGTDYTVGTVRKYLGEIKRAEKQTAARH